MAYEDITTLDELFAVAKKYINMERAAAETKERTGRRVKDKDDSPAPPAELYANPENWVRGRGIALIHEDTNTLLGNFIEYTHKSDSKARKLLRADLPIPIAATEQVSGDWWITKPEEVEAPQSWHVRKEAVAHLFLPKLGVHSPATPVIALVSYGAVARVELAADTTFAQIEGEPEQLLMLPAGTNLLPVMSQDSKIEVKLQVLEC